jgi:hypothetical protein
VRNNQTPPPFVASFPCGILFRALFHFSTPAPNFCRAPYHSFRLLEHFPHQALSLAQSMGKGSGVRSFAAGSASSAGSQSGRTHGARSIGPSNLDRPGSCDPMWSHWFRRIAWGSIGRVRRLRFVGSTSDRSLPVHHPDLTGNFCTSRIERLSTERSRENAEDDVYAREDRREAAAD